MIDEITAMEINMIDDTTATEIDLESMEAVESSKNVNNGVTDKDSIQPILEEECEPTTETSIKTKNCYWLIIFA